MQIENGRIRLVMDPRTGSVTRIADTLTGVVHFDGNRDSHQDGRLFRLIAPSAQWQSRYADSHASAPPVIKREGGKIIFQYPVLTTPEGALPISAEVEMDASAGRDEIRFVLRLRNDSDSDITDVIFPWLGGWTGLGGRGQDRMVLGGAIHADPHDFPKVRGMTYLCIHQRAFYHSVYMPCPWLDLSGPRGGLGYMIYHPEAIASGFTVENLAGYEKGLRLAVGQANYTWIRPGQTWTSPVVGISLHGGDWRDTADRYNSWVDTWYRPAPTPEWARQAIGFQNVFFRGFEGTPFRGLETIPEVARIGRKYGVSHLSLWDANLIGVYSRPGDCDVLDYSEGEKAILRRVLRETARDGSQVSALVNWRLTQSNTRLFRELGEAELTRAYDGSLIASDWSCSHHGPNARPTQLGPASYAWDPRAPRYRERVKRQVREYLELGFTSLFYDQPFEFASYTRGMTNESPAAAHTAAVSLADEVCAITRELRPDGIIIGENGDTFCAQHIDLWMQWYTRFEDAILGSYAQPQTIRSWVVDSNVSMATRAFAIGSQLCLTPHGSEGTMDDVPELSAYVAKLAKLRVACGERYYHARFRHTRGLELKGDGSAVAFAFDSPQGPAVVVAAPEGDGRVEVAIDLNTFTKSNSGQEKIYYLDGRVKEVAPGDRQTFELKDKDIAVWMP